MATTAVARAPVTAASTTAVTLLDAGPRTVPRTRVATPPRPTAAQLVGPRPRPWRVPLVAGAALALALGGGVVGWRVMSGTDRGTDEPAGSGGAPGTPAVAAPAPGSVAPGPAAALPPTPAAMIATPAPPARPPDPTVPLLERLPPQRVPAIAPSAAPPPGTASTPEEARQRAQSEATEAAWVDLRRRLADTAMGEAERMAAVEQFLQRPTTDNPRRAEAEEILRRLRDDAARRLAGAPPDRGSLGRLRRATYVGGTHGALRDGAQGQIALGEKHRMLFLAPDGSTFVPVPYAGISSLEYGLSASTTVPLIARRKSHFVTVQYRDPAGERQAMVLELGGDDLRPVLALLEARSGVKVAYQDEKAAAERWK